MSRRRDELLAAAFLAIALPCAALAEVRAVEAFARLARAPTPAPSSSAAIATWSQPAVCVVAAVGSCAGDQILIGQGATLSCVLTEGAK